MQPAYKFAEFKLLSDEEMEKSPSRMLGMSREEEAKMLKQGSNFVSTLAKDIELDRVDGKPGMKFNRWFTIDGAISLLRRYFSRRSLQNNDRYLIATAALMLQMKTEGDHRSPREFAYHFKSVKSPAQKEQLMRKLADRRGDDADIIATMDHILFAERAILYALNFSIHNDHPYNTFVKLLLGNKINAGGSSVPPDQKDRHHHWIEATSNTLLQSFKKTQLCLQYPDQVICAAAMDLLSEKLNYKIPRPEGICSMQEVFDVDPAELKVVKQKLYDGCFVAEAKALPAGAPPMPTFRPVIIPAGGSVPSSLDPPPKAVNHAKVSEGMAHPEPPRSIEPSAPCAMRAPKAEREEMEEGELVSSSHGIHFSLSSSLLMPHEVTAVAESAPSHQHPVAPLVPEIEITTSPNGTNPDSCPQSNHLNNSAGSDGMHPSVLKRARCEDGEVSEPPGKLMKV